MIVMIMTMMIGTTTHIRPHVRVERSIRRLACLMLLLTLLLTLLTFQPQPLLQQPFLLLVNAIRILPSEWSINNTATTRRRDELQRRRRRIATTSPVHVTVPTSPDDHIVESLPLLVLDTTGTDASSEGGGSTFTTKHWAGHLPVSDNKDKYFFYWLFAPDFSQASPGGKEEEEEEETAVPIIIWLNGGPACSSMDGLFIENGPFSFQIDPATGKYRLVPNRYSWHKAPAYTLYIDQPVGTGLSFTTSELYPTNDHEVNVDFYYFLQQFFTLHRDKFVTTDNQLSRKLYFSGESYAGHYIPSLMNYLLKKKGKSKTNPDEITISVAGGAIGNGWTDPFYQYAGAEFAYGHVLIGAAEVTVLQAEEKICQEQLNKGIYSIGICFALIDNIIDASFGSGSGYKASGYDVRVAEQRNTGREFPPGHKIVETYLGGWKSPSNDKGIISNKIYTKVLEAIHATAATTAGQVYQECTDPPYNALSGHDGLGVVDDVVDILKHPDKVQLLFFNGVHDIICNHVGNEKFLEKLPWEHAQHWYESTRYTWIAPSETPGKVSGYMKEYENLNFLKVMDAGHMVPMDVPNVALDMMTLFVTGGSFDTSNQELKASSDDDNGNCSICPTCLIRDSGTTKADETNYSASHPQGTVVISYTSLLLGGVAVIVIGFLVGLIVTRRSRRHTNATTRHQPVPQYELELRDTTKSSYHDNDDDHMTTNGGTMS